MKLAEALALRTDIQRKLENLKKRLGNCVRVQDGLQVLENPETLKTEAEEYIHALYDLTERIYRTNYQAVLPSGKTMIHALAERDELTERRKLLRHAVSMAVPESRCYSDSVKWQLVIDVHAYERQIDDIAYDIRKLNMQIQQTNWQVDLVA